MQQKDGEEAEGELADAAFDCVHVFGCPEPRDAGEKEEGGGAEDGEGEVCADEVGAVDVGVEAEVARVVADGEADGEEVDGEQHERVERRVSDLGDGVDLALVCAGIEMHFSFVFEKSE